MSASIRRLLPAVLLALATPLLAAPTAPAISAAAPSYVALGDSYSSGTGTRSYLDDGTTCQRSASAYPSLIAAASGYALTFRACSGADVADVTNTQLSALGPATSYVTISVGGNDAGFADVLTECATPWWAGDCDGAIDDAQAFISNTLPGRLSTLYAAIRSKAPAAKVVVVGYPRIFMGRTATPARGSRRRSRPGSTRPPTCSTPARRSRPRRRGSPSPIPPRASSATRCATTWSGSTGSPTPSARATTPTSPVTRPATRPR